MSAATLVAILTAILSEAPQLIGDLRDFVAAFEGKQASNTPLGPQVEQDTAALDAQLKGSL